MRSKASFNGHPYHPALIPFPIAFLSGAFAFNELGVWFRSEALWTTGAYLAVVGVASGIIAAVPGLIDLIHTVPPHSSGRQRAVKHMLLMLGTVALFAFARVLRDDASDPPSTTVLGLQALGTLMLMAGGWLGGTLVSRNMASVDHRYANAGKWQEQRVEEDADGSITVEAGELGVDQMRLLRVDGRRLVLARTAEGYVAFDDRCTHRGGSLAGGVMMCGTVQCLWHGSQFDVVTGEPKAGPAELGIATYRVEAQGNRLRISGLSRASAAVL